MKNTRFVSGFSLGAILAAVSLLGGCSGNGASGPFAELENQGLNQYRGVAKVMEKSTFGDVTTFTFDPASGPICLQKTNYLTSIRDIGSDELFLYLTGGGACWKDFCFALSGAFVGIVPVNITNFEDPNNPVRNMNTVQISSCDGSLFAGDADHDDDGDGIIDRPQHGIRNLTAALDIAKQYFPNPRRVFLAGSSAGGFGTIMATPLVRIYYPDVPLCVFSDSGPGIIKTHDPQFLTDLLNDFNVMRFIPKSCKDCIANGHLTGLIGYGLEHDPNMKLGLFSSYGDKVYAQFFLGIGAQEFGEELAQETSYLNGKYPDRFKMFLTEGEKHTSLIGDATMPLESAGDPSDSANQIQLGGMYTTELNGVTIADWIRMMLADDPGWVVETAR
ncbi:MAG: pectin acetylesterase-family hydrolase [Proteobacteria bacterium]|nr:pectin acetylesterase-family hydrolase [Pseudomonadota bacterium]